MAENGGGYGMDVLLGKGDGTFKFANNYAIRGTALVGGDFNGDGILDLAVAGGGVTILLGNGDGTFQAAHIYYPGGYVGVGDFNRDGIVDLAVGGASTVSVFLGHGDGTFQNAQAYAVLPDPVSMAVADFNGDGLPDIAVVDFDSGIVTILLNAP